MAPKSGQTLKLKDASTTFHDPETRFKIAGDQEVTIDPKAKKGKLTLEAIQAGGLIEVDTKPSAKEAKDKEPAK